MKAEVTQIIRELKEICSNEELSNILDKDILDFALKLYIANSINKQKNYTKQEYKRNDFKINNSGLTSKDELPTESQKKEMQRLGLVIPAGSSKKDVWRIIKEYKEKK